MSDTEHTSHHRDVNADQRLFAVLEPVVEAQGLLLEDVHEHTAGTHRTIQVFADVPADHAQGLTLDVITELSAVVSDALDKDPNDDSRPYDLEVSSPGVHRPLGLPRHWARAVGRLVKVTFPKKSPHVDLTARLIGFDGEVATLQPEIVVKKGMKPKLGEPVHFPITDVRKAVVEVEFTKSDERSEEGTSENSAP